MVENAYAKLNLTLEITGSLQEGYHEIISIFQKIKLSDRINIEKAFMDEVTFNKQVYSRVTTVHIARDLFRETSSILEPVAISVKKSIPVGSGLGGGSSDSKATLTLLNNFFGNPLSCDKLLELGTLIGSDVPFFFNGSTALVSGRGEVIEPITNLKKCFVLLVFPDFHSPTKIAYDLFDRFGSFSSGAKAKEMALLLSKNYSIDDLNGVLYNDFEVIFKQNDKQYKRLFDNTQHVSGVKFHLTGSGSSIFSLFESREKAEKVSYKLQKAGYRNFIAETV